MDTQEQLNRYQVPVDDDAIGQCLLGLDTSIEHLREFVYRRGGLRQAKENMGDLWNASTELHDLVREIHETLITMGMTHETQTNANTRA